MAAVATEEWDGRRERGSKYQVWRCTALGTCIYDLLLDEPFVQTLRVNRTLKKSPQDKAGSLNRSSNFHPQKNLSPKHEALGTWRISQTSLAVGSPWDVDQNSRHLGRSCRQVLARFAGETCCVPNHVYNCLKNPLLGVNVQLQVRINILNLKLFRVAGTSDIILLGLCSTARPKETLPLLPNSEWTHEVLTRIIPGNAWATTKPPQTAQVVRFFHKITLRSLRCRDAVMPLLLQMQRQSTAKAVWHWHFSKKRTALHAKSLSTCKTL